MEDILNIFSTLVVGGLGTFSNLLVNKAFGFDVLQSQLLSMPTGTVVVIIYAITAYIITKTNQVSQTPFYDSLADYFRPSGSSSVSPYSTGPAQSP